MPSRIARPVTWLPGYSPSQGEYNPMLWEKDQSRDSHPKIVEGEKLIKRGDVGEALQMWEELALSGEVDIQVRLGLVFAEGELVPQDYPKAAYWFRKAAEYGDAEGQVYWGHCLYGGQGTEADEIQAFVMFALAAQQGHPQGIQFRDRGQQALSREDLDRATDLMVKIQTDILERTIEYPVVEPKEGSGVTYRQGFHEMHIRKSGRPYFLVDRDRNVRILQQNFSGWDTLQYQGESKNGLADGKGKARLSRGDHDDYPGQWEGFFRNGVYLGKTYFSYPIQVLREGDFLINISDDPTEAHPVFLYKGLSAMGPLELTFPALPQVYVLVPEDFSMLDEEAVKARMLRAGECVKSACPDVQGYDVHILSQSYQMVKGNNSYQTGLEPVLAVGRVVLTTEGKSELKGYDNPQAAEARDQEKAERQQAARERASQLAPSRNAFDVRGVQLWMNVEEVHAVLEPEGAVWTPPYKKGMSNPFSVKNATIKLDDGATFELSFTSRVTQSILCGIGYRQELRQGPPMEELIQALNEKYGKPDETDHRATYYHGKYFLQSRVTPNEAYGPGGALGGVAIRADSTSGRVETLSIGFSDPSLENQDSKLAVEAREEEKRQEWERKRSDHVKF